MVGLGRRDVCLGALGSLRRVGVARASGVAIDFMQACVSVRGERRHDARAYTVAFAGAALDDTSLRAE